MRRRGRAEGDYYNTGKSARATTIDSTVCIDSDRASVYCIIKERCAFSKLRCICSPS